MSRRLRDRHPDEVPLQDLRILVVEDEVLIAIDLCDHLEGFGASVQHARTLSRAVVLAQEEAFDAAVLDVTLSRDENCGPVAEILHAKGIPFIFHSGDPRRQDGFMARFAAPLVEKPSSPDEIVSALNDVMQGTA
jgi:CheY-like chemotaxis protein